MFGPKGDGAKYVETRVSVPDTTIPDYQIISPRAFSNLIRGNRFHPSKPVPGRKLSGVGRCNGFGRNLSVRTTYDVEIDRVAW